MPPRRGCADEGRSPITRTAALSRAAQPSSRPKQTGSMPFECSNITANRREPTRITKLTENANVAGDRLPDALAGDKAVSHPLAYTGGLSKNGIRRILNRKKRS